MTLENKLHTIEKKEERPEHISFRNKLVYGARNYLIDTSAKIGCYAPLMGAMEAATNYTKTGSPEMDEVIKTRLGAALIDAVAARIYTKTADCINEKTERLTPIISRSSIRLLNGFRKYVTRKEYLDIKQKRNIYSTVEGARKYVTDTCSMIGVYTPIYAGILKLSGDDNNEIGMKLIMGAGIAAATSRPFRKYALMPWRKICGYKK